MNIYHISYTTRFIGESMAMLYFGGCNFSCRNCLRKRSEANIYAERSRSIPWDMDHIVSLLDEIGTQRIYLEGYEPTLDPDLVEIVGAISRPGRHITLMTNGSLLTRQMALELIDAGVDEFIVGVKAFDEERHIEYTGTSNGKVLEAIGQLASIDDREFRLQVETVLLPGVNDPEDVEDLARFLASIDPSISLFIEPYIPSGLEDDEPTREDLIGAMTGAMRHLYICFYHPLFSEIEAMRRSQRRAEFIDVFPRDTEDFQ
jgi:molybdenum cofactor biosynthesis enzyme MoaA